MCAIYFSVVEEFKFRFIFYLGTLFYVLLGTQKKCRYVHVILRTCSLVMPLKFLKKILYFSYKTVQVYCLMLTTELTVSCSQQCAHFKLVFSTRIPHTFCYTCVNLCNGFVKLFFEHMDLASTPLIFK